MPTQEVIMTSATMKSTRSAGGGYAEGRGLGMIIFAAVMVAVIGFFNLLDGIAAIANSHIFIGNAHYVVGDLRLWGWVMTIFGVMQLLAVFGVWAGNQLARWFAVAVVGLNAIGQMFFIPAYPFWSLLIIALDVVALWGLCAYGSRENLGAA
jgi:hypothetical protein